MEPFHMYIPEYQQQLEKGAIQKAYRGLLGYILTLKTHLKNQYPDYYVSGSLYFGYMDMTYFSFHPKSIADRRLKIAVVFLHEAMRFEVWLAGSNKQVQSQYWRAIKESGWSQYHLVHTTQSEDSILEHVLVDQPDFVDLNRLTRQLENGTMRFIEDVEGFLNQSLPSLRG